MITIEQARQIADEHVARKEAQHFAELENPDDLDKLTIRRTLERSFGWVFMYGSDRFSVTRQVSDVLMWNFPFVVDRNDGSITELQGSAEPPEYYMDEFEKTWKPTE